ncbi:hypothetical protein AZI87_01155 [Bdellovibrio bacteriovorus]|uniref:Uncharacterized protein n=1 Tax=Bdellovibrio bacteriovorus TaxID=959 RepID=A0A161PCU3_BDEBC|nr:hypothetical protein [Bdellovibrio bacteriovorus]KYG67914.1 hypothetical protein AZI87_01155 [Bdellovibrio bacteriovorus]
MRSSYTTLMQSKYFNPAFNSAIFDGPVRIYFAQFHEALALKIYFLIQQKLGAEMAKAKEVSKASGANILVMVYPTVDSFALSFEGAIGKPGPLEVEKWHDDVVIGLRGPIEDENLDLLIETLRLTMENWRPAVTAPALALAEV